MRLASLFLSLMPALALPAVSQPPAASIDPPPGSRIVLEAKGKGVQIYGCSRAGGAFKWTLQGPDAKLFDANGKEIGSHFAGPTWRLADGGQVQGELVASQLAAETGAVPWLLLRTKAGSASGTLAEVAFIRRSATHGGTAPASGCAVKADVGATVRVPYTADYAFYSAPLP